MIKQRVYVLGLNWHILLPEIRQQNKTKNTRSLPVIKMKAVQPCMVVQKHLSTMTEYIFFKAVWVLTDTFSHKLNVDSIEEKPTGDFRQSSLSRHSNVTQVSLQYNMPLIIVVDLCHQCSTHLLLSRQLEGCSCESYVVSCCSICSILRVPPSPQ